MTITEENISTYSKLHQNYVELLDSGGRIGKWFKRFFPVPVAGAPLPAYAKGVMRVFHAHYTLAGNVASSMAFFHALGEQMGEPAGILRRTVSKKVSRRAADFWGDRLSNVILDHLYGEPYELYTVRTRHISPQFVILGRHSGLVHAVIEIFSGGSTDSINPTVEGDPDKPSYAIKITYYSSEEKIRSLLPVLMKGYDI